MVIPKNLIKEENRKNRIVQLATSLTRRYGVFKKIVPYFRMNFKIHIKTKEKINQLRISTSVKRPFLTR